MVAGSLSAEWIRRDGGGRGYHEREGKGSGRGSGNLIQRNKEGIMRRDFEGGGVGVGVDWEGGGRLMQRELQMGLE